MGGRQRYRYEAGTVSAGDPLPTAETVALARGFASRACADQAATTAWGSNATAHTWIDRVPMVGLAALIEVCPEVTPERLARCLGLDPLGANERLRNLRGVRGWNEDLVAVVAQQIARGA